MPTQVITISDLKNRIGDLITFITEGGSVILEKDSKPFARLIPISDKKKKRIAGLNKGEIWTSDDFDDPLPDSFWTGEK
ncbi:Toxin-antitoxin system, antitoxin component [Desulfonema limicola]|uniref:Toxin-antitoxin system, antitoxin component n=1 Tax=Desulfonema limicola TaxID=45656 RepID=A0A975BDZ9_9BACT|nr:type II toxin-antitoxin system prevent-host-death family antitoxin [Desulfonema limicola]QTA83616.1 Toxin-antitoxin system, antitoxin component [Desulfonema limicola]